MNITTNSTHFNIYGYKPSEPAAITACLVFAVVAIVVLGETLMRCRRWYMLAVVVGGIAEAFGYAIRVPSSHNPTNRGLAIGTILPILLAPIVIALGTYWTLGSIVKVLGRKSSFFPPKIFEWAFVGSDVISFVIQGAGGAALTSSAKSSQHLGKVLLIVGLSMALASFSTFFLSTIYVELRTRPTRGQKWRVLFVALYITTACLIVRSTYRLVEYVTGYRNYIGVHEIYFYLFDAIPMGICIATWIFLHPTFFDITPGPNWNVEDATELK